MVHPKRIRTSAVFLLALLLLSLALCGCGKRSETVYQTLDDLSGKTIAVVSGSVTEQMLINRYGDDVDICYFNSNADMAEALEARKADFGGSGTLITEEQQKSATFSEPTHYNNFVLTVKGGAPLYSEPDELAGKTIGCISGASTGSLLEGCYGDSVSISYYNANADLSADPYARSSGGRESPVFRRIPPPGRPPCRHRPLRR